MECMVAQTQKLFIMTQFTVISTNPKDTYNYGIFQTIAIAAIMVDGLEQNFKNQTFMVVELKTLKPVGKWA